MMKGQILHPPSGVHLLSSTTRSTTRSNSRGAKGTTIKRGPERIEDVLEQSPSQLQEALDDEEEYSLTEIRANLGPIGKTIAGAVEVGIVAAGSYISGGILGYFIGGTMGLPTLFRKLPPDVAAAEASNNRLGNAFREFSTKMKVLNSKAVVTGKNWGTLSASFSGFHALCRVARGGKEDKWNTIIGSAATGAFLNRSGKHNNLRGSDFLDKKLVALLRYIVA